jgi:AhpC/TSA family protein
LPPVHKLYGEFKDKGLEVRLINFREDADSVRRVVRERGYTIPTLIDATGDVSGRLYGVFGPPTVYFVNRRGELMGRASGARAWGSPAGRAFVRGLLEAGQ